jgi:glycosyltransferase involved in cell wall biosynthesis
LLKQSLKKISALLGRKVQNNVPEQLVNLLRNSKKFKTDWYFEQYPEVQQHRYWRNHPEAHYLQLGAAAGYNPAPWFDTQWYLTQYQDVANSGINPFVHYLTYGNKENRLPNSRKLASRIKKAIHTTHSVKLQRKRVTPLQYSDVRERLALHLWGGLSVPALSALEAAYQNPGLAAKERWSACWHASRWYYFKGEFDKTLQLGNLLLELDPAQALRKEGVLLRAFCLNELGRPQDAKAELQAFIEANPNDADGYFTFANSCLDNDELRLSLINKALAIKNYAPIALADSSKPLSLDNLVSQAPAKVNNPQKISIIMPVYSAEAHLHIAVNSLLQQSCQNLEIIIVDDCSPDGTFELAQQLSRQDSRIIALKQPVNAGAYAARNAGLKIATGDFITTHDSDDWSHPQKLETQLNYFAKHPKAMGICTHWIRVRPNMLFTQNWRPNNALTHWSQSSFMFKRQVLNELGGWDEVRVGGDTEFIWRVKAKYGQQGYAQIVKEVPLAFALDDQSSLTRTKATHVRTVYFGLRHIYREICAWWHRTGKDLHIEHPQSRTTLPIPVAMQYRDGRSTKVDVLLISDYSDNEMSQSCYKLIAAHPELHFGLMHWPNFTALPGKLSDKYFETLTLTGAIPVAAGEQLIATHLVYANELLMQYQVDATPELLQPAQCWLLSDTSSSGAHFATTFGGKATVVSQSDLAKQLLSKH